MITDQLEFLMQTYPIIKHLLAWFFIARIANKTVFAALQKYVELTPEIKDNKWFIKITENKYYKIFSFVLDMSLSIKLPKSKGK